MTQYTDEQVAEACAVLSKDHIARQTLVEMWAGKRRSVFQAAVERLSDKIGGSPSSQQGTTDAVIYLSDNKRVCISLVPVKNTYGMLDVRFCVQSTSLGPLAQARVEFRVHKAFEEELGEAFPSDRLVSELFLMKEFAE